MNIEYLLSLVQHEIVPVELIDAIAGLKCVLTSPIYSQSPSVLCEVPAMLQISLGHLPVLLHCIVTASPPKILEISSVLAHTVKYPLLFKSRFAVVLCSCIG